jgi:long-chain acyl-CoA synthetase
MVAGGRYTLHARYRRFSTVIHALDDAAERLPDRLGLIVPTPNGGERKLTYRQYRAAVGGMARHFAAKGARGRPVVVCMGNGMEAAVACLGAMAAGALAVPMNPNYTPSELKPLLKDVAPHILCCEPAFADRARDHAAELGIAHVEPLGTTALTVDGWAADATLRLPEPLPRPTDPSFMVFTGGTTGLPKGAEHTHATLIAHSYATLPIWPMEPDAEVMLDAAPIFHVWGFCLGLTDPLVIAATSVLMPGFKPADVLAAFVRHRVSIFCGGPPAMYVGLRANEHYKTTDFSNLRWCLSGGAPCPEELLRAWERETGTAILEGIGMSEGAPFASSPMNGPRKIRSVGVIPPDTDVEVVDLETGTKVLPVGERGEVRIRGPQFIKAYRNRPDESAKTFRDGWLYTGDIGYFDEDDYLFIVDRKKEMILVGGYNVYPREIDEVLHNHPAILEAATVGVPDSFHGEAVKSYVALKPGAQLTQGELEAYCAERLVKYKRPKHIEFLPSLPKTGVGKINKLELKARG